MTESRKEWVAADAPVGTCRHQTKQTGEGSCALKTKRWHGNNLNRQRKVGTGNVYLQVTQWQ
jgi:hypothetical protein